MNNRLDQWIKAAIIIGGISLLVHCTKAEPVDLALQAAVVAHEKATILGETSSDLITIVDFSQPATTPRLRIINVKSSEILLETRVTHGEGSGVRNSTLFSDIENSHQSSIGLYKTGKVYYGRHGLSLRVSGLEPGFNGNAKKRAIVVHSAIYATEEYVKEKGYLGRSWGCFAVSPAVIKPLIKLLEGDMLILAYYPEPKWLDRSIYLKQWRMRK